jgi:serine/threonine protein kinase
MSAIYLAQRRPDAHTERSILRVYKLLLPQLAEDPQWKGLFQREIRILLKLNHQNIIQLEDHGCHDKLGYYICMEFLNGHSLKSELRKIRGLIEPLRIKSWCKQICDALQYCHQQDIVHRDLKPENVFLQGPESLNETLKLFDFGVSACKDEGDISAIRVGTPRYMAPEQVVGVTVDGRADLYSLGVMLFELLTRRALSDQTDSQRLYHTHLYAKPPSLAQKRPDLIFPEALEQLFQSLLAKSPDSRPSSASELYGEFATACPDQAFPRRKGRLGFVVSSDSLPSQSELEQSPTPLPQLTAQKDISTSSSHLTTSETNSVQLPLLEPIDIQQTDHEFDELSDLSSSHIDTEQQFNDHDLDELEWTPPSPSRILLPLLFLLFALLGMLLIFRYFWT